MCNFMLAISEDGTGIIMSPESDSEPLQIAYGGAVGLTAVTDIYFRYGQTTVRQYVDPGLKVVTTFEEHYAEPWASYPSTHDVVRVEGDIAKIEAPSCYRLEHRWE